MYDELLVDVFSISFNFIGPDSVIFHKASDNGVILNYVLSGPDGFHENFPKVVPVKIENRNNTFYFSAGHETFNHITVRMNDQQELITG